VASVSTAISSSSSDTTVRRFVVGALLAASGGGVIIPPAVFATFFGRSTWVACFRFCAFDFDMVQMAITIMVVR
jgi:hypothetical protein